MVHIQIGYIESQRFMFDARWYCILLWVKGSVQHTRLWYSCNGTTNLPL